MAAWSTRAPTYRDFAEDQLWDQAVQKAFNKTGVVGGNTLDVLPASAHPHIRAAAAFQLLEQQHSTSAKPRRVGSIGSQRARRAPDARAQRKPPRATRPAQSFQLNGVGKGRWAGVEPNWSSDNGEDSKFPAVHFRKDARRATDPDPLVDAQIAILESLQCFVLELAVS